MSDCSAEEEAKDLAYDAYAAALDNHYDECQKVPRDEEAIMATGEAAAELFQDWLDARAAWITCVNNASGGGSSPPPGP